MAVGSLTQVIELIRQKAGDYIAVNRVVERFGADFEAEMQNFLTKEESFYSIFVAIPSDQVMTLQENVNKISVKVFCHGKIQSDRSNVSSIISDASLILSDLYRDLDKLTDDYELEGEGVIYSENNSRLDLLAGVWMQLDFIVVPVTFCEIAKASDYGI